MNCAPSAWSDRGSIAAEYVDVSLSQGARDAELAAEGSPADAVVWEDVERRVLESSTLSISFLVLMVIATMMGAIGILTDSIILLIGAMLVGPEYGPLAGISVAVVEGRLRQAAYVAESDPGRVPTRNRVRSRAHLVAAC